MQDIWSYFQRMERDLLDGSGFLEEIAPELAPDDQSGTLRAKANLRADTELDAYLNVYQRAVLDEDGQVELVKYSYYLVVSGEEARGWEKDPTHDPPVHGHIGKDHLWTAASEVSLKEALNLAWNEVQVRAESQLG
jgi:hypothetical protein